MADAITAPPVGAGTAGGGGGGGEGPGGGAPAHVVRLAGCRSRPLISYLKALGLLRVLTREADPGARGRWASDVFELRSKMDADALAAFLTDSYSPTPVVSPWNGGSGFFEKDNHEAFDAIETSTDRRLTRFREAIGSGRTALAALGVTEKPSGAAKVALIRRLRASLDDDALEWLDASIVLLGEDRAFPPLLGSGGNDGRYDYANNYAQAVIAVAGDGDEKARKLARAQLATALHAHGGALRKMSAGHLLRDSSPVNSPGGESHGLGNPWDLVLAIEGCCLLVAGAARRHWTGARGSLVAPFTVRRTAAGYGSAVADEQGRDELWLPLWPQWTSVSELGALLREGRAQVGRRQALTGLDFARAAGELGVARGIDRFERFVLLERAGQATLAVPAGRVEVRDRPAVLALQGLDRWLQELQAYSRGDCPRSHREAIRRLERRTFVFADRGDPPSACAVLEALGNVESALSRAARDRSDGTSPKPLASADVGPWLSAADDGSDELAVAASLATLHDGRESPLPAMRDYLHGTERNEHGTRVYDGAANPIDTHRGPVARLALLHRQRHIDAWRHAVRDRGGEGASSGERHGQSLAFSFGVPCPLASARAFARGELDEARIVRLAAGLAIVQSPRSRTHGWRPVVGYRGGMPFPAFDVLALAFAGTDQARPAADIDLSGRTTQAAPIGADEPTGVPLHARPGWVARLAASRDRGLSPNGGAGHVRGVVGEALLHLRVAGLTPLVEPADVLAAPVTGRRLAAALLLHLWGSDLDQIAAQVTTALLPQHPRDQTNPSQGENP